MIKFKILFELMKPRVMYLSIFTSLVSLISAYSYYNKELNLVHLVLVTIFISLGAGASGVLNMWWDRDIDVLMSRTKNRPIPSGQIESNYVLFFGLFLTLVSTFGLFLSSNFIAAALLLFTIFFYIVIYTIWLKRYTPQNIVIGGAAGALPPVVAWSSLTGEIALPVIILFLIIFYWTPAHFWSLSIYNNKDYQRADIPMLTVTNGVDFTIKKIVLYTFLTIISVFLYFILQGNIYALIVSTLIGLDFLRRSYELKFTYYKEIVAKKLFLFSIKYLFIIFSLILFISIYELLTK